MLSEARASSHRGSPDWYGRVTFMSTRTYTASREGISGFSGRWGNFTNQVFYLRAKDAKT